VASLHFPLEFTSTLVHSCVVVDQRVYLIIHRLIHKALAWRRPGAGVIGACSHAGPGSFACGQSSPLAVTETPRWRSCACDNARLPGVKSGLQRSRPPITGLAN